MDRNISKPHAIMIAFPYQGHINPYVDLALKLASNGFSITFAHFEFVHHKLSETHVSNGICEFDPFSEARKSGLDIRYTTIKDCFPVEYDRTLHIKEYWSSLLKDFEGYVDEFVGLVIKSNPSTTVHFLVVDTLFVWGTTIANKYKLVHVSFWILPALAFSLSFHTKLLKEHGHFPIKDDIEEEINYIPGVETINTRDFMTYVKESDVNSGIGTSILFSMAFEQVKKADFILYNTVQELEANILSALVKNENQKKYTIGPIHFSKNLFKSSTNVTNSFWSESDCTHWLESKPPGSVIYISFGSLVQTSKQVLEEIAYGLLLLNEVNFIWVVRSDIVSSTDADVLPRGFLDEVKDKGLIVPWCNQTMVLSNPAVGGFLTQCGWNSVLESIWYGTPMICCPIYYEQQTTRKLIIEDWKIGTSLCDGLSNVYEIKRDKFAKKIKSFMNDSNGYKQEMKKVQAIVRNAIEVNGSSERNFDQFVKEVKEKIYQKYEDITSN